MKDTLTPRHVLCGSLMEKSFEADFNVYYCPVCHTTEKLHRRLICEYCFSTSFCGKLPLKQDSHYFAQYEFCANPFCPSYSVIKITENWYQICIKQQTPCIRLAPVAYCPDEDYLFFDAKYKIENNNKTFSILNNHFRQIMSNLGIRNN